MGFLSSNKLITQQNQLTNTEFFCLFSSQKTNKCYTTKKKKKKKQLIKFFF